MFANGSTQALESLAIFIHLEQKKQKVKNKLMVQVREDALRDALQDAARPCKTICIYKCSLVLHSAPLESPQAIGGFVRQLELSLLACITMAE